MEVLWMPNVLAGYDANDVADTGIYFLDDDYDTTRRW